MEQESDQWLKPEVIREAVKGYLGWAKQNYMVQQNGEVKHWFKVTRQQVVNKQGI